MRPVFVALICLGLIISNGKSAPTKKQNSKWHECLDECTYNFDKHMGNTAFKAFLVPQIAAWLNYRNQSFTSMIMEGVMSIDTYKHKNDYTVCLNQCDMYYIRPYDTLLEEGLEDADHGRLVRQRDAIRSAAAQPRCTLSIMLRKWFRMST